MLSEKGVRTKKKVFKRIHLKSDLQSTKSDSQCPKNLANHLKFAKVIHNYPDNDSHLTMRYRLFPALYLHVFIYLLICTFRNVKTVACIWTCSKVKLNNYIHECEMNTLLSLLR